MSSFHVVTSPCIGVKDAACVAVCPVDCFYDAGEMLMIHPEECVGCGLCESECPVNAIFAELDVPEHEQSFIARAHEFFAGKTAAELERLRRTAS